MVKLYITSTSPGRAIAALDDRKLNARLDEMPGLIDRVFRIHNADQGFLRKQVGNLNCPELDWAAYGSNNLTWVAAYFFAGLKEYKRRFNHEHPASKHVGPICNMSVFVEPKEYTKPPVSVRNSYKNLGVVEAYRTQLAHEWASQIQRSRRPLRWTNAQPPSWLSYYFNDFPDLREVL